MVHLPVAADQRLARQPRPQPFARAAASRRAARPGRSPFSMNSSDAPPPVERWSTLSARPNCLEGTGAVAPADHRERLGRGHRFGDGSGAGDEAGVLEDAHGAVPEDGGRRGDLVGEGSGAAGADVEARPAFGHVRAHLADLARRSLAGAELAARREGDDVGRHKDALALAGGTVKEAPARARPGSPPAARPRWCGPARRGT